MSVPSSTFQTDNISNSTAEEDAGNRYSVCQRTGFRVKPGELIEDAYGALVRQESFDRRHPQELIRPLAEELTGPRRPEASNNFIYSENSVVSLTENTGPGFYYAKFAPPSSLGSNPPVFLRFYIKGNTNAVIVPFIRVSGTFYAFRTFDLDSGALISSVEANVALNDNYTAQKLYGGWLLLEVGFSGVTGSTPNAGIAIATSGSDASNPIELNNIGTGSIFHISNILYSTDNIFTSSSPASVTGFTQDFSGSNWELSNLTVGTSTEVNQNVNGVSASDL